MTLTEAIQQRIRELCRERNITLNHLSMLCGMTQSTVHNIFARPNNSPTISTIKKICDGLDITLGEYFQTEYFDTLEQELQECCSFFAMIFAGNIKN